MKVATLLQMRMEMTEVSKLSTELEAAPSKYEKDLEQSEQELLYRAAEILRKKVWSPRRHTLEDYAERKVKL